MTVLRNRSKYGPHAIAVLVICFGALMLLWRPVLRGETFLPIDALLHLHPWRYSYERVPVNNPINTDPIKQIYPRREWTENVIRQGQWPLWNPTVLTGTPNLSDGQTGTFYPPTLLFLVVPLAQAFGYYAFLHVIVAGLGMYAFARALRLNTVAALVGGVCYMLNGYLMTWLYFPHHTGATAMLPWCFWAVERALARRNVAVWALAALVCALPVLSHLQLAVYIYLGLGCYVLARLAQFNSWRSRMRALLGFSATMALALAISAVQLLPALDLAAQGQRGSIGEDAGSTQDQFLNLVSLALPAVGGAERVGEPPAWGPALVRAPMPYVGLLPLALVAIALVWSRRTASGFFGLFALVAFALAVGSPLVQLLQLLPFYSQFADQTRWFVLWYFATAVLAALGMAALWGDKQRGGNRVLLAKRVVCSLGALGLLVWAWQHLQLFTPNSRYGEYITLVRTQPQVVSLAIGAGSVLVVALLLAMKRTNLRFPLYGALVSLVLFDLLWFGGSYNSSFDPAKLRPTRDLSEALAAYPPTEAQSLYPPTRQISLLQREPGTFRILGGDYTALPPNIASAYGLEDVRGYMSLYFERFSRLTRLIDGKDYSRTGEGAVNLRAYFSSSYNHRRLLDMLNVRYMLFEPGSKNPDLFAPLELVNRSDEGTIYRNPNALPRAWLVHAAEVLPDDMQQLDRLATRDFDPARTVILATQAPELLQPTAPEPIPEIEYAPNRATVRAEPSAAAMLVVSDAYNEDWQVTVDGEPAPLYRANYALRGVWLPAGAHTIEFVYRPRSFMVGGVISLVALVLACGAFLAKRGQGSGSRGQEDNKFS